MGLKDKIEIALNIAKSIGTIEGMGGAASVSLRWNPYESHWEAKADWSSGQFRIERNDDPEIAIQTLIDSMFFMKR